MTSGDTVLLRTRHKGKIKEFLAPVSGRLHTEFGIINLEGAEIGGTIQSHLGQEFSVISPRAPDFFRHARRTGAPMIPRDIGMILAHAGLCASDTVLEAGTGSGLLSIFLGNVVKRVVSYEIREDFARVAGDNVLKAGLRNVEVRCGDLVGELPRIEEIFDAIVLDMGGAEKAVQGCFGKLGHGGFLVTYSPFLEQTAAIRREMENAGFFECRTYECLEREITFSERGTRPSTFPVGHTGYLTFARK